MEIITKKVYCILLIIFPVIVFISSCKSLKEDQLFIGTWQVKETITTGNIVFSTTRTLTLTKKTYEETYVIERNDVGIISAIIGLRGDLVKSHSEMTFALKELGTCVKNTSDICTNDVQWFGEGTQYWTDNIAYFELLVKAEFEADETTLHLKRDMNNDGDLDDTGEDIEFERI